MHIQRSPAVDGARAPRCSMLLCGYISTPVALCRKSPGRACQHREIIMLNRAQRSIDENFYHSPAWKRCRAAFIAHRETIDGGMCQRCQLNPGKIVHHRVHLTQNTMNDPDICYGFDNLEYVCLDCHNIEHGFKSEVPERMTRYAFDQNGNPIPIR